MKWLILLSGIGSNAGASILIKIAMSNTENPPKINEPLSILFNLPLVVGLCLYGIAFVLYAFSLTKFPLSIAHPILTSGAIALVAVVSSVIFAEQLTHLKILGIVLIIAGVVALSIQ